MIAAFALPDARLVGALLLALVVAMACWRIGRRQRVLLALQPLLALALWLALWPPPQARPGATLVVATANTTLAEWRRYRDIGPRIRLPEAPLLPDAAAHPDLATALRRLPGIGRLRVLGDGLVARDREAVGARGLDFEPPPPRAGVIERAATTRTAVGQPWRLRGRIAALPGARVELLDPAGARVASTRTDAQGSFELATTPASIGRVDYALRVRDASGHERERLALPLDVVGGRQPRLWLLSGGPDPEQKFLRRWGEDAGLRVRAGASLGGGVQLGDAIALDAASLGEADLLVLDARALRGLGAGRRAQLRSAVAQGLGLLLRWQDAPNAADRALLREFGFDLAAGASTPVRLAGARAPFEHEEVLTLTRAPLQATGDEAVVLLRDADGVPLARWRALGRGRVAAWWLGDSYRLVLSGQAPLYQAVWSQAAATLARADAAPSPRLRDGLARAQQRAVVCDLGAAAQVRDPDGRAVPLLPDASGCAGWWPARPGWHRILAGGRVLDTPVLAEAAWPGLRAQADREATLVLRRPADTARVGGHAAPGPRCPGFVAFLLLAALAWWLERRPPKDEPRVAVD